MQNSSKRITSPDLMLATSAAVAGLSSIWKAESGVRNIFSIPLISRHGHGTVVVGVVVVVVGMVVVVVVMVLAVGDEVDSVTMLVVVVGGDVDGVTVDVCVTFSNI
ncbi:hypothetical protein DPMN_060892 [Dreissena polymorpha]|uniref:Transmembrane protein n=1 Tax=Dreissena polymorpha TaxID=45954 RepID=A0A9D4C6U2_DREPO|nr:hypothetical protein DPMN_060892 [Dreissena polymorpha]